MGILEVLTVAFVIMKLAEIGAVADWSWWAVTAPLWVVYPIIIVIALIVGFGKAMKALRKS